MGSHAEAQRRYRARNLDRVRESNRQWNARNRERVRESSLRWARDLKAEAFAHYGERCARCGSTDDLHLHHVNGGGNEHRRQVSRGAVLLNDLRKQGWPPVLQTLCGPCHREDHA